MLRLRLLGPLSLVEEDGTPVRSVLGQPKRFALLARLAAIRPGASVRRDTLVALFWPRLEQQRARTNLRQALYQLRRSLEPGTVTGKGKELVGVDPEKLWCDAAAFSERLAEGSAEQALELYRGPFLDGFHLPDAPAFERWLDTKREELLRNHQGAVEELAREAEEERRWMDAARWWARAVRVDPYDSRLAARRVTALARAGDRANAVQEGMAHAQRLRTELDLDPGSAFLETLERIRSGELGPATSGDLAPDAPAAARASNGRRARGAADGDDSEPPEEPGPSASAPRSEPSGGRLRRFWAAAAVMLGVTVAAAIVGLFAWSSEPASAPLVDPLQLTTATGIERSPSWSPNGRALAYQSDQDGDPDIWVTQLGTGEADNRTASSPFADRHPRWSPDGRWIAFASTRGDGGYFLIPAMGGRPRQVAPWPEGQENPTPPAWSPDGDQIAYGVREDRGPAIQILTLDGGATRRLALPLRPRNRSVVDMSWSPNGRFLAYRRAISPIAATTELWLTSVSDGESVRLTSGSYWDGNPAWSPDSRQLFFVSDRGGSPDLWTLALDERGRPSGAPRAVTAGMELTDFALSPDGRKIAFAKGRRVQNVFRAPLFPDRAASWSEVRRLTFDEADFESVDVDPDGRLLLSSDRSGNWDIFLRPADGGPLRRLTTDSALDAGPSWKPGGGGMAFYSNRSGHRQVWLMALDGRRPRQLTDGPTEKLYPDWSPDGREIAVSGGAGLTVHAVEDGTRRWLAEAEAGGHPDWSPDGRWVVFVSEFEPPPTVLRVPASGGTPERLTDVPGNIPRWSPDGDEIYFLGRESKSDTIWSLSLDDRTVRPVVALANRPGRLGMGLAVDDRHVYFTWRDSQADLWIADFRR